MEYVGESGAVSRSIFRVGEEMEALRHTNPNGKMGVSPTVLTHPQAPQGQGLLALLVMVSVLVFIIAYCCWGAPCCRSLCHRIPCCQSDDASNAEAGTHIDVTQCASTPTIILLPYGRMLVVDGAVFAQFQAETTGLDLLELGESVLRAQGTPSLTSTPSILDMDSEVLSKDHGSPPLSLPPTYESLFQDDNRSWRLPPSYSDTLHMTLEMEGEEEETEPQLHESAV